MIKPWLSLLLASVLASPLAFSLTPGAEVLVHLETKANAISTRSDLPMPMPHYEIPLELVGANLAERFQPEYVKHLIFEKDGKKYVRWILNPEDTKWSRQVVKYFRTKGVTLKRKYYFTGYQTASRSYIVEDPNHEIQFSVKSSTNRTGGNWSDKKQPVGEAVDSRLNADFLADLQKKLAFKNIIILDEPAIFTISGLDQAVVIRDLGPLNNRRSEMIYVPGFSLLHENTGTVIAAKNGSKHPRLFWHDNYVKPVGRALGELAARTGMQFDSPHSQNFLVELTKDFKPTGRIVLRDLADLYVYSDVVAAIHSNPEKYFRKYTQKDNILDHIAGGFGPLHGNKSPTWVNSVTYRMWMEEFLAEFEKTFEAESKIPVAEFKKSHGHMSGRYFANSYEIPKNEATREYWNNMTKFQTPRGNLNCSYIFQMN